MRSVLLIFIGLIVPASAGAAIPQKLQQEQTKRLLQQDVEAALMALRLPYENRLMALRAQGDKSFSALLNLAQDAGQGLQVRWKAMTSMGKIYPEQSKEFLGKSLEDQQWFVRNAALLGLAAGSRSRGVAAAKKLIDDPALVVRTAAVQTLRKLKAKNVEHLLWQQLNHERNFRNGKSLWIRKHIVRALAETSYSGDEIKFARLLTDKDPRVQVWAVFALERLQGRQHEHKNMPLKKRREKWLAWSQQKSFL